MAHRFVPRRGELAYKGHKVSPAGAAYGCGGMGRGHQEKRRFFFKWGGLRAHDGKGSYIIAKLKATGKKARKVLENT
jgi:hypothetical protein